jgi:3-isopropylmalate/(R)-2-methylmalate dehydratase small subunit
VQKLNLIEDRAIPLPIEDIDTDQIIPARFLKATSRSGFGENLFRDWRYQVDGTIKPDFILNNEMYKGSILVAGRNFGCGSSREHAAWALYDYGFKVVVSSFFADIFKGNALNNGLLPIQVNEETLHKLFNIIEVNPNVHFLVDVASQTFVCEEYNLKVSFDLDPYKKICLLNGFTDLDFLLDKRSQIEAFEARQIIY